jgi:hypothetical protein
VDGADACYHATAVRRGEDASVAVSRRLLTASRTALPLGREHVLLGERVAAVVARQLVVVGDGTLLQEVDQCVAVPVPDAMFLLRAPGVMYSWQCSSIISIRDGRCDGSLVHAVALVQ